MRNQDGQGSGCGSTQTAPAPLAPPHRSPPPGLSRRRQMGEELTVEAGSHAQAQVRFLERSAIPRRDTRLLTFSLASLFSSSSNASFSNAAHVPQAPLAHSRLIVPVSASCVCTGPTCQLINQCIPYTISIPECPGPTIIANKHHNTATITARWSSELATLRAPDLTPSCLASHRLASAPDRSETNLHRALAPLPHLRPFARDQSTRPLSSPTVSLLSSLPSSPPRHVSEAQATYPQMPPGPASPERGGLPSTTSPSLETGESNTNTNTFTDSAEEPQLRESDNTSVNVKPGPNPAEPPPTNFMRPPGESTPLPNGDGGSDLHSSPTPVRTGPGQEYFYSNEGRLARSHCAARPGEELLTWTTNRHHTTSRDHIYRRGAPPLSPRARAPPHHCALFRRRRGAAALWLRVGGRPARCAPAVPHRRDARPGDVAGEV